MNNEEMRDALARRDESVLKAIADRYGPYIRKIAFDILHSKEDAEETENDVYLKLWNNTDKEAQIDLKAYLGMLSRQSAIDKLREISAKRRGSREYTLAIDELAEAIPDNKAGDTADTIALRDAVRSFLQNLPRRERQLFLCRYWYAMSIRECADAFGMRENAVRTALHRDRKRFKAFLEKEDFSI